MTPHSFDDLVPPRISLKQAHAQAVISFKWNTWASKFLYFELGLYLLWLMSFQAFCLLFQAWTPSEPWHGWTPNPLSSVPQACSSRSIGSHGEGLIACTAGVCRSSMCDTPSWLKAGHLQHSRALQMFHHSPAHRAWLTHRMQTQVKALASCCTRAEAVSQPPPSRLVDAQDEDTTKSLGELLHTRRGLASVILEGLALVGMAPFLWIELSTVCEYGPRIWLNTWNILDCLTYAGQVSLP